MVCPDGWVCWASFSSTPTLRLSLGSFSNARARLVRQGVVVYEGRVSSLRRFKEDVRTVAAGFECGIGLENFNDVKEGDTIEAFELTEVARQ